MNTVSFKEGIELLGYTIVKYNKGFNYRTAFARNKDGELWYFSIEDLRDENPILLRRIVRDLNDYSGGSNMFNVRGQLENMGYTMVEERSGKDFNGN